MNTDMPVTSGMNFSILGMPSTSYQYSINGMDMSTPNAEFGPTTGTLGLTLGQNQIEEVTVVSTGYSGQFGEGAGGNINYATKSGSNAFHGNAQYFWNGSVFNANDWFNKALGNPRPFDIANQWAGTTEPTCGFRTTVRTLGSIPIRLTPPGMASGINGRGRSSWSRPMPLARRFRHSPW